MVERLIRIREAPGSIPGFSTLCIAQQKFLAVHIGRQNTHTLPTVICQGGLAQVVERSICIREAPGSIPGFSITFMDVTIFFRKDLN